MLIVVDAIDAPGGDALDAADGEQVFAASGPSAAAVFVDAVEALSRGTCRTAVVVATALDVSDRVHVRLRRTDDPSGAIAIVRAAGHVALPGLVARAGQSPRDVTLFGLSGWDAASAQSLADEASRLLKADPDELPRWTVLPLSPGAASSLRDIAGLADAVRSHTLPGAGQAGAAGVRWPFGASPGPRPWIDGLPRRAGAWFRDRSNEHAVLFEEIPGAVGLPAIDRRSRSWPRRLVLAAAETRQALESSLAAVRDRAASSAGWDAFADEVDRFTPGRYRAAILARDGADLAAKTDRLITVVRSEATSLHTPDGVFFGDLSAATGKTAFLFPGQGAQYVGMLGDLCLDARSVQTWFEQLQSTYPPDERCPPSLLVAPPSGGLRPQDREAIDRALMGVSRGAMVTLVGSLAMHDLLAHAGARADAMVGYSSGENGALVASGAWRLNGVEQLFGLLYVVRKHDEADPVERGACLAVNQATPDLIRATIDACGGEVHIALENCPEQVVIFGPPHRIRDAAARLTAGGAFCVPLAFDRGHHTPIYWPTVARLKPLYDAVEMGPPDLPLYSAITAAPFPADPDEIRDLASSQWARTVRFGDTVNRMYDDGVRTFVEVGPGSVLTGFVRNTLKGRPHLALASNLAGRPGIDQVLFVLGRLFVAGQNVDPSALRRPLVPRAAPVGARVPVLDISLVPGGPRPAVRQPATSTAAARQVLTQHFELMQAFLDAQERAHALLMDAVKTSAGASPMATPDLRWALLGDGVVKSARVLTASRSFTLDRDRVLRHHTIGVLPGDATAVVTGLPVVPFAVSFELACEAGVCLVGHVPPVLSIRNVRASRWLAVDEDALAIRVRAAASETPSGALDVEVRVFDSEDERSAAAFELTVCSEATAQTPAAVPPTSGSLPVRLDLPSFARQLFHGPALRGLHRIAALDHHGIEVQAIVPPIDDLVAGDPAPALLTSIALVDMASQVVALWLPQVGQPLSAFPFQLDRYVQWGPPPAPGEEVTIRACIRQDAGMTHADIDIVDASGSRRAHLGGLRTKSFDLPAAFAEYLYAHTPQSRLSVPVGAARRLLRPLPAPLVDRGRSIWIRVLASVVLSASERQSWARLRVEDREAWLLGRIAGKEAALDGLSASAPGLTARDLDAEDMADGIRVGGVFVRVTPTVDGVVAEIVETPARLAR